MPKENRLNPIRKLVLDVIEPGVYQGLVANGILQDIISVMVDKLKGLMANFSTIDIIKTCYKFIEEFLYAETNPISKMEFVRKYNFDVNVQDDFDMYLLLSGASTFRFLAEAALVYGGCSGLLVDDEVNSKIILHLN